MELPVILIVDDDPGIRKMLVEVLQLEGYHTETAVNGQDALALLASSGPRVIFLDLWMPVLDGWGMMELLNADPEARRQHKVILVSAVSNLEDAHDLASDGMLPKPFTINQLLNILSQAVQAMNDDTESTSVRQRLRHQGRFDHNNPKIQAGRTMSANAFTATFNNVEPLDEPSILLTPDNSRAQLSGEDLLLSGDAFVAGGKYQIALEWYAAAFELFSQDENHLGMGKVAEACGQAEFRASRPASALFFYSMAKGEYYAANEIVAVQRMSMLFNVLMNYMLVDAASPYGYRAIWWLSRMNHVDLHTASIT